MEKIKAYSASIKIPTYETGKPNRLPMFFDKRVYQGSSGRVYPHPVCEGVADVKTDREGGAGTDEKRGGQAIPAQGGLLRRVDAARFPVSGREGWRRRRKERASRDRRREPLQRRRTGRSVLSADQEKDRGDPPEDSAERMYPADGIHSAPLLFFYSQ